MRARTRQPIRSSRSTGPTGKVKEALDLRAGGRCELCGRNLLGEVMFSRHHRRPRRMGGSSLPWINNLSNLLLICGSATSPDGCHLRIEHTSRTAAYDLGWLLRDRELPWEVPVHLVGDRVVYLTDEGDYAEGAP